MEPKTIKLFEGINLTIDGETVFCEGGQQLWANFPAMNGPEWDFYKTEIFRALICNRGHLGLSDAFRPHSVFLAIVPCKDK